MLGGPSGRANEETAVPDETSGEHTHFWRAAELGGVELLHARYVEQRFAPHVHSSFALVIIEQGAQRFRHRGGEHLAPLGSMVLINPDEVHTGSKAHDAGWLYRGYYPEMEQIDGILDELEIHHGGVPRFADSVIHDQPLARAFVHLHRLLAEHAGSLETQTRWRETMLALFRRHARLPEAPKAGQEPLAVARARELLAARLLDPPSLEELAARSICPRSILPGSSVAPPACRPTPGSGSAAWSRPGHCSRAAGRRWRWPWSWASPTRATSVASSSRPTGWHRVNTARPARARP